MIGIILSFAEMCPQKNVVIYKSPGPNNPWPHSRSKLSGSSVILQDPVNMTSEDCIRRICNMMDKYKKPAPNHKEGDYELPKLPPTGMRFGPPV